jgi:hypothetical protein
MCYRSESPLESLRNIGSNAVLQSCVPPMIEYNRSEILIISVFIEVTIRSFRDVFVLFLRFKSKPFEIFED